MTTLATVMRPLQKSVGRLLCAKTSAAVGGPGAVADQFPPVRERWEADAPEPPFGRSGTAGGYPSSGPAPVPSTPIAMSAMPMPIFAVPFVAVTMPDAGSSGSEGQCEEPSSAAAPAPAWQLLQWPAGVLCPVFMHAEAFAQPQLCGDDFSADGCSTTAGGESTRLPGRTGASRRQRRRQQMLWQEQKQEQPQQPQPPQFGWAMAAAPSAPAAPRLPVAQPPAAEEQEGMMLFPPTPEHSPCSSPRTYVSVAMPPPAVEPWADASEQPEYHEHHERHERHDAQCAGLLADLASEDAARRGGALRAVVAGAWPLATSAAGCRVVQRALAAGSLEEQLSVARQLQGRVREAAASPHANHVLQKCIEVAPAEALQFVHEELRGHAAEVARHRFGCRVIERLLEHCPAPQLAPLVEELLAEAGMLCRHTYGNFVVQHVMAHGTEQHRQAILEILVPDVQRLARHRVASHVVRAALTHCSREQRQPLVLALQADAAELSDLAHHHCGSFVVRELRREMLR